MAGHAADASPRSLAAYLAFVAIISAALIVGALALGARGTYLAGLYMFGPALAAIAARALVRPPGFRGAGLRPGRLRPYVAFWLFGIAVVAANVVAIQLAGALHWDLRGDAALAQIDRLAELSGQPMPAPPAGLSPRDMLVLFTLGGLTVLNLMPGLLTGFGEEFGWRGLMFPALYRVRPWIAVVFGGLVWYAWHLPLLLVVPATADAGATPPALAIARVVALGCGAIATHTLFAYAYARAGSIWVPALLHGTIDNASRAAGYWVAVTDQAVADIALAVSMVAVVGVLLVSGELRVIEKFFRRPALVVAAPVETGLT